MSAPAAVYRPRNPQLSDYYHCVEDYFETFVGIYYEQFSRQFGCWRPYIEQVIYRYLDCGDLHNGFARVKCKDCNHEYLLAFSCKHLAHHAIRNAWWNSGSGSARMSSRRFLTVISYSASRRSSADTSSEPVLDLIGEQETSCRSPAPSSPCRRLATSS